MKNKPIIISITGPESTGKSTLCGFLAKHFNTTWLPEYGRTYLENLKEPYSYQDILNIAKEQIKLESEFAKKEEDIVFLDTDLINIKIWLTHYSYKVPNWINKYIASQPYTHSLLLYPDTPWVADNLREHPNLRQHLFNRFKNELELNHYPFTIIKGLDKLRETNALNSLKFLLQ